MGFGWFEKDLASDDISTFTYIFEIDNQNVAISEVYAFLTENRDSDGCLPVYAQMRPTVSTSQQDVEIRGYQGGQKLLCFVVVKSLDGKSISSDPKAWGIRLRRK
jgi:hypothetical protein